MQLGFNVALYWFLVTATSARIMKRNFLWREDPFFEFCLVYWDKLLRQRIRTCIYIYIYVSIDVIICRSKCTYIYIIHWRNNGYVRVCVCVYIYIYIRAFIGANYYVNGYVRIYIYIYMFSFLKTNCKYLFIDFSICITLVICYVYLLSHI